MIQDNRKWSDVLVLLLNGEKRKESGCYAVELRMKFQPVESRTIPLEKVVNMGFADDRAGDCNGGWTDSGAGKRSGRHEAGPTHLFRCRFRRDRSGGQRRQKLSGPLPVTKEIFSLRPWSGFRRKNDFPYLYLLHATAWTPPAGKVFGTLHVRYRDGRHGRVCAAFGS